MAAPVDNRLDPALYEFSAAMQPHPTTPADGYVMLYVDYFNVEHDNTGWAFTYPDKKPLQCQIKQMYRHPLGSAAGLMRGLIELRWMCKGSRLVEILTPKEDAADMSPQDFVNRALKQLQDEGLLAPPIPKPRRRAQNDMYRIENFRDIGTALYIQGLKSKISTRGKLFVFLDDDAGLLRVEPLWAFNNRDPLSQQTRIAFVGWIAAESCTKDAEEVLRICQRLALHMQNLDGCVDAVVDALRDEKMLLSQLRLDD
ncbi:hypothetical protein NLG97_g6698 [Lecanicillium saksenae]|uniref:Uncharacterized protein n=1 Tax=Lecanicillium saksenae TaxID=468837 RepID=A0ACC1QQR7_9HYPO|nr:hypothetical protein NLG97_g6698 [Lecanicillium saksenae]